MASFLLPSSTASQPQTEHTQRKNKRRSHRAWRANYPSLPVVPSFWKEGLGVVEKNTVFSNFYRSSIVCLATTPHPSSPEEGTTN